MIKKITLIIAILFLCLTSVLFINATTNDFESRTGGLHQIKDMSMDLNNQDEAKIIFNMANSPNMTKPKVTILGEDEPVFFGEKKVEDPSLGKYKVELMFTDTRIQKEVRNRLGLKTNSINTKGSLLEGSLLQNAPTISKNSLLQSIKVAYPPDDSLMVIYLGCKSKPNVDLQQENNQLIVNLKTN